MNYRFFKSLSQQNVFQVLTLILLSIAWAGPVKAKEIYFQPSIGIRTESDDNKRLSTENSLPGIDKSAYAVITRANAKLGMRSSNYNIELNNQLIINRYKSEFDLDSEDFNINLSTGYNWTEKSRLGLEGNFTQDTTLTSELDATGTGLVQDNVIRQEWSLTHNWSYSLSNTQFLQTSYTHSETTYEESERSSFVDYSIDNISLSFRQQWTSLLSNTLSVSAMSFKIPKIGSGFFESSRETTEYSVNIGVDYQLAPTWSTSLTVGQRFTNTETTQKFNFTTLTFDEVTTSDDVQGLIFSFSVDKQFYSGSAGLKYSRSTSAQSQGELQVNERIDANYKYKVNSKLQLSLTGGLNEISISGSEEDNNNGRTYFNVSPSVRWIFNRQTNITAAYRYRTQTFERDDEEAVSNSVSLNFNYQWDKVATQKY